MTHPTFKIYLLLLFTLLLQSCIDIVERIDLNKNRSGSFSLSVSITGKKFLFDLLNIGIDTEVLDDIVIMTNDAADLLQQCEGISNVKVVTGSNKMTVALAFDFDNQHNLNRALYYMAGEEKTIFKPAIYKFKRTRFERKNITKFIKQAANGQKFELKPSLINYITEVNLPRPAKMVVPEKAEVMWFTNNDEKWVAVIGLYNDRPYEIFTGKAKGFFVPEWVTKGCVIKNKENEISRYDFQFQDKEGFNITMEGLSRQFNKEYWNYAKLISGILRHGMPLPYVVDIVDNLLLDSDTINTWKNGVVRALKKYIPDGTIAKKGKCPNCNNEGSLIYREGCITCTGCGYNGCE